MVKARARAGFTLIELTIAIVLLAIGLLALAGALARALHVTTEARVRHAALREAEGVADSLSFARSLEAGSAVAHGIVLDWSAQPCGSTTCARVRATIHGDTLSLLGAASPSAHDAR